MKKLALLALLCLLVILTTPSRATSQGEGIVEGQVINATAEALSESVAGLEIALYAVTTEAVEFVGTTTTDRGGRFRFTGLDTDDTYRYRFELEYEDIVCNEESVFPQGKAVMPIVVTVYETIDDEEAIIVNRHHVIMDFVADALNIQEMYVFENTTDRIYVGDEETTLRFSLPTDAVDLRLDDPELEYGTTGTEEGFASLVPLVPGQSQVLLSYNVPYDGREHNFARKMIYPTTELHLMVADVGVLGESKQLAYRGLSGGAETAYLHFEAQDLLSDAEVQLHLSGAPQAPASHLRTGSSLGRNLQEISPWFALGLTLLGTLLPFAQLYRRERPQPISNGRPSTVLTIEHADTESRAQREELLQLIADLDDAFAERQLGEEAYRELRKSMKRRLMDMRSELGEDR